MLIAWINSVVWWLVFFRDCLLLFLKNFLVNLVTGFLLNLVCTANPVARKKGALSAIAG